MLNPALYDVINLVFVIFASQGFKGHNNDQKIDLANIMRNVIRGYNIQTQRNLL